jgi:hypothetical protein
MTSRFIELQPNTESYSRADVLGRRLLLWIDCARGDRRSLQLGKDC